MAENIKPRLCDYGSDMSGTNVRDCWKLCLPNISNKQCVSKQLSKRLY